MHLNMLAFAVPLFAGLMYLEYFLSLKKGKGGRFQFNETVANLNVGIVERLTMYLPPGCSIFSLCGYIKILPFSISAPVFLPGCSCFCLPILCGIGIIASDMK